MNQTDPTAALRAVLTVTVETRPDGGHYFAQADFAGHVTQWVRAALKGKHAIGEVTITEQPAAAPAVVAPPTGRAAWLTEAVAALDAHLEQFFREWPDEPTNSPWACGWKDATDELRRLAAEAHDTGTQQQGDADATEADIDRMMAAGVPVQIVTRPPDTRGAGAQQQPGTEALTPRCDHCKQPGHSFEDCPRADEPAPVAQQPAAEPAADLIEDSLKFLRGQGPEPDLSDLPAEQREAITGQFEIVKALADRDAELPPLAQDPVARRLGLRASEQQPAAADGEETRCAECPHPHAAHREGEDPVTPGVCVACPEDDAHHDYRPARETGASGC